MPEGQVYFSQKCTNCNKQIYGSPPELLHALWEDGGVDQHSACSRCAIAIKKHNEEVERKLNPPPVVKLPPKEVRASSPLFEEYEEAKQAVPPDGLSEALLSLAETQKAILTELREMRYPPMPVPVAKPKTNATQKAAAKPPARRRSR
jgi:hypothetical protein